jgi:hypothetical protein
MKGQNTYFLGVGTSILELQIALNSVFKERKTYIKISLKK